MSVIHKQRRTTSELKIFQNERAYENAHVFLWLIKDTSWCHGWRVLGMAMILPTLTVQLHLTWNSRKDVHEVFHSIAVACWIIANAIWMTGEFFYQDFLAPFRAMVLKRASGVDPLCYCAGDRFALEAHQDEHPAFNRRAVGSIPIGRTRRSFFMRRWKVSCQTFYRFTLPCVPLVQWITTRVYETRDSGSSPERDTKFLGVSSSGQDGALSMPRRGFDSPRARQVRPSQLDIRQPLTRMPDGGRFDAGKLIR